MIRELWKAISEIPKPQLWLEIIINLLAFSATLIVVTKILTR